MNTPITDLIRRYDAAIPADFDWEDDAAAEKAVSALDAIGMEIATYHCAGDTSALIAKAAWLSKLVEGLAAGEHETEPSILVAASRSIQRDAIIR